MFTNTLIRNMTSVLALTALVNLVAAQTTASHENEETPVQFKQTKLSGPRLGITYVVHGSEWDKALDERGIDNIISQFGWHFEWLLSPRSGGPAFVTELIPFFGGVEYGTVIPSLSLIFGIRFPKGFEFGMGPQVVVTMDRSNPVNSSLVVAAGQSLDFSGVKIPINLALATNDQGQRVSFVFGYAVGNHLSRKNR